MVRTNPTRERGPVRQSLADAAGKWNRAEHRRSALVAAASVDLPRQRTAWLSLFRVFRIFRGE